MKTLDDIHRQDERIIAKHPYLLDVDFRPVSQSGLSVGEIARFMDASWKDTYQGRERFDVHSILSLYPAHGIKNFFLPTRNVISLKAVEFRQSLRPCEPMIVDHK